MKKLFVVVLLLSSVTFSSASELSSKIEEQILNKDWRGVYSTLDNLKSKTSNFEDFKRLTISTKAIVNFLRDYDSFMRANGHEAVSFREAINNGYNNIPSKLPFSRKLIAEIVSKKNEANNRFTKIDEDLKKEKEEKEAKFKENERSRKDADILREKQISEQIALKEKERETRERYLAVQDEIEKSPEYLKVELPCKICSAVEEKKALERALVKDMNYAKKYGVVNLSRRDSAVQMIKADDKIIQEGKAEYKGLVHKPFTAAMCNKIKCEECEETLLSLSKRLTEKYLAEHK
jgi:hypothetical protein